MEMASIDEEKRWHQRLWAKSVEILNKLKKLGQDDPRRIVHSLKVGLAITLVSLFYYFEPLFGGFGVSAMWAVLTVVVVFEFSVGATLGKGLNRGLATLVAGALGVMAHHLAVLSGNKGEPIVLSFFVFLIAACVTFLRFYPRLKAKYDYGLIIFILTFCLISVSGYRDDEVLEMAHRRLSTILIGGSTALIVCIFICPVWAGKDLHNSVANNIEKLGDSLEGFGAECSTSSSDEETTANKMNFQEYRSVLNSKNTEETLVNLATWEPPHGDFKFRHPWKQYLKIGSLTRQCAYRLEALNSSITADIHGPNELIEKIQDSSTKVCLETGKAMKELAFSVKTMARSSSASSHISNSKKACKSLKSLLNNKAGLSWEEVDLLDLVPTATMVSLLIDVVSCTEKIVESVNELATLAKFSEKTADRRPGRLHSRKVQPRSDSDESLVHHHTIAIE